MHDGRFPDLKAVLEHYRSGVVDSPTLDERLRGAGGRLGLAISDAGVADLRAFLQRLTDRSFITNPDYGPPLRADRGD